MEKRETVMVDYIMPMSIKQHIIKKKCLEYVLILKALLLKYIFVGYEKNEFLCQYNNVKAF